MNCIAYCNFALQYTLIFMEKIKFFAVYVDIDTLPINKFYIV